MPGGDQSKCARCANCQFDPVEWGGMVQKVRALEKENEEVWRKIWEVAGCLNNVKIGQAVHNVKIVVITSALMLLLTVGIPYLIEMLKR